MCFFVRILSFLAEEDSIRILGMHVCNFTVELWCNELAALQRDKYRFETILSYYACDFTGTFNTDVSASGDWMNVKRFPKNHQTFSTLHLLS